MASTTTQVARKRDFARNNSIFARLNRDRYIGFDGRYEGPFNCSEPRQAVGKDVARTDPTISNPHFLNAPPLPLPTPQVCWQQIGEARRMDSLFLRLGSANYKPRKAWNYDTLPREIEACNFVKMKQRTPEGEKAYGVEPNEAAHSSGVSDIEGLERATEAQDEPAPGKTLQSVREAISDQAESGNPWQDKQNVGKNDTPDEDEQNVGPKKAAFRSTPEKLLMSKEQYTLDGMFRDPRFGDLTSDEREILKERYVDDKSLPEIGQKRGISPEGARTRLDRIKSELRKTGAWAKVQELL